MDYLIYADGSYEAIPTYNSKIPITDMLESVGAVRLVWISELAPGKWLQIVLDAPDKGGPTDDIPDEIKLHAMLV